MSDPLNTPAVVNTLKALEAYGNRKFWEEQAGTWVWTGPVRADHPAEWASKALAHLLFYLTP